MAFLLVQCCSEMERGSSSSRDDVLVIVVLLMVFNASTLLSFISSSPEEDERLADLFLCLRLILVTKKKITSPKRTAIKVTTTVGIMTGPNWKSTGSASTRPPDESDCFIIGTVGVASDVSISPLVDSVSSGIRAGDGVMDQLVGTVKGLIAGFAFLSSANTNIFIRLQFNFSI